MKKRLIYTVAAIAGVVLLQIIMVWCFDHPAINKHFNLTNKGTLGDAINGMTAPVIALISAAVLFWSFQEQVQANKILTYQWQFENSQRHLEKLQEKFVSFESMIKIPIKITGISKDNQALANFANKMRQEKNVVKENANKINDLINDFRDFLQLIGDKENPHRDFFFEKTSNFYHAKIKAHLEFVYKNIEGLEDIAYTHLGANIKILQGNIEAIDAHLLKKLRSYIELRKKNRKRLDSKFYKYTKYFYKMEKKNFFDLDPY